MKTCCVWTSSFFTAPSGAAAVNHDKQLMWEKRRVFFVKQNGRDLCEKTRGRRRMMNYKVLSEPLIYYTIGTWIKHRLCWRVLVLHVCIYFICMCVCVCIQMTAHALFQPAGRAMLSVCGRWRALLFYLKVRVTFLISAANYRRDLGAPPPAVIVRRETHTNWKNGDVPKQYYLTSQTVESNKGQSWVWGTSGDCIAFDLH